MNRTKIHISETFLKWIYPVVVMLVIFVFSSIPGSTIDNIGMGKETFHVNAHFIMFLFLCMSFYKSSKNILLSFVLTLVYSLLDEFHQRFTPNRSSSLFDIYVDNLGGLIGLLILWKQKYLLPNKLRNWLNK